MDAAGDAAMSRQTPPVVMKRPRTVDLWDGKRYWKRTTQWGEIKMLCCLTATPMWVREKVSPAQRSELGGMHPDNPAGTVPFSIGSPR